MLAAAAQPVATRGPSSPRQRQPAQRRWHQSAMRLFISRAAAWFKSFAPPFCHPPLPWLVACRTRHAPSLACRRCADRRVGVNPGTLLLWNGWADFQSEKRTAQRKVRCVRWARPFASAALPAGGVASPSKVHPKVRTLYSCNPK